MQKSANPKRFRPSRPGSLQRLCRFQLAPLLPAPLNRSNAPRRHCERALRTCACALAGARRSRLADSPPRRPPARSRSARSRRARIQNRFHVGMLQRSTSAGTNPRTVQGASAHRRVPSFASGLACLVLAPLGPLRTSLRPEGHCRRACCVSRHGTRLAAHALPPAGRFGPRRLSSAVIAFPRAARSPYGGPSLPGKPHSIRFDALNPAELKLFFYSKSVSVEPRVSTPSPPAKRLVNHCSEIDKPFR